MTVRLYHNVFLTRSGIGMKHFRLIDDTIHLYKGKRAHFLKYALFHFFFRTRVRLRGTYFIIHNHWCPGYFHWVTEALVRLAAVADLIRNEVLILPDSFKHLEQSVRIFYKGEIKWLPKNHNAVIENLLVPQNPPASGVYNAEIIQNLARRSREYYGGTAKFNFPKIYVTRRKAAQRFVANEAEVIEILMKNGFTVVDFGDYSFSEQVCIAMNAKVMMGIHGAGLTNLVFARPGTLVVEFQKRPNVPEEIDVLYRDLARILSVEYQCVFCSPIQRDQPLHVADILINLEELTGLLQNRVISY